MRANSQSHILLEVQETQNSGKESLMGQHDEAVEVEGTEEEFTSDLSPFDPTEIYEVVEPNDKEDVPAALKRETQDGKGGAVVPKANFVSYAADAEDTA
jgi:hypothetical protein